MTTAERNRHNELPGFTEKKNKKKAPPVSKRKRGEMAFALSPSFLSGQAQQGCPRFAIPK